MALCARAASSVPTPPLSTTPSSAPPLPTSVCMAETDARNSEDASLSAAGPTSTIALVSTTLAVGGIDAAVPAGERGSLVDQRHGGCDLAEPLGSHACFRTSEWLLGPTARRSGGGMCGGRRSGALSPAARTRRADFAASLRAASKHRHTCLVALKLPPRPLAGPASHRADSCSGFSSAATASEGPGCLQVPAARTAGLGMLSAKTAPGKGTGRQRPCQLRFVSEMPSKACSIAGRGPRPGAAGPEQARQG